MTTLKTAWTEMLKVAGIEKLRPYDLRHTAITRLCENPANAEEVIESIAGHITHDMKKRYSHVRVEARRAALAGLVPERLDKAYPIPGGTNDGNGPSRTGKPLNNQDVLGMVEAGLPPKVLVAKTESGGTFVIVAIRSSSEWSVLCELRWHDRGKAARPCYCLGVHEFGEYRYIRR